MTPGAFGDPPWERYALDRYALGRRVSFGGAWVGAGVWAVVLLWSASAGLEMAWAEPYALQLELQEMTPVQVNLFANWGQMAEQALWGHWLLALGMAGLVLQWVLLAVVVRRRHVVRRLADSEDPASTLTVRRFGCWPETLALLALLAPLLLEGVSLYVRLQLVAEALQPIDPSQRASLLPSGKERLYGPLLASMMMAIQAVPAGLTLAWGTFFRQRWRGLRLALQLDPCPTPDHASSLRAVSAAWTQAFARHPSPPWRFFMLVGLAGAVAVAALGLCVAGYAASTIETFSQVARVPPDEKRRLVMLGLTEAEILLEQRLWVVAVWTAAWAVGTFIYLHFFSATSKRHELVPALRCWPQLSRRSYLTTLGACLVGSALCLALAWPLYQERHTPVPPGSLHSELISQGAYPMEALQVQAPDPLRWSPLLQVQFWHATKEGIIASWDGAVAGHPQHLEELAAETKQRWQELHPREPFLGVATFHCDQRIGLAQVRPFWQALQRAGYRTLQLAFVRTVQLDRPLLGRFPRRLASAARIELVKQPPAGVPFLQPNVGSHPDSPLPSQKAPVVGLGWAPAAPYGALARAAVQARQRGQQVVVAVEGDIQQ